MKTLKHILLGLTACFMITLAFSQVSYAQDRKVDIRKVQLSKSQLDEITGILKTMDPKSYNAVIVQNGKVVSRLGSANLRGLQVVGGFHAPNGNARMGNEILTSVSNYIKTIWTSDVMNNSLDKVTKINQILDAAVIR